MDYQNVFCIQDKRDLERLSGGSPHLQRAHLFPTQAKRNHGRPQGEAEEGAQGPRWGEAQPAQEDQGHGWEGEEGQGGPRGVSISLCFMIHSMHGTRCAAFFWNELGWCYW